MGDTESPSRKKTGEWSGASGDGKVQDPFSVCVVCLYVSISMRCDCNSKSSLKPSGSSSFN